jgi:general secretion pathway protein A
MYLNFYGLKESPFNTTPDPKFLYLTPQHREALSQLIYGIEARRGFMVLIGEVGTGKTTLVQTLIQRLHRKAEVAFISHSKISFDGILDYIFEAFGIETTATSRAQRLSALNHFLIQSHSAGRNNVVLIIDEAQNLDPPTLEEVRLLSNFETPTEKLLQILLVGQPELQAKLELPELRQLQHRIGLHCGLTTLTPQETHDYIKHRLHVAGAHDGDLLTARAIKRIAAFAEGNPRIVNMVCDHCLLIGYADQTRKIDRDIAEQAIHYLAAGRSSQRHAHGVFRRARMTPLRGAAVAVAVALLGGAAFQALRTDIPAKAMQFFSGQLIPFLGSGRDLLLTFLRGV